VLIDVMGEEELLFSEHHACPHCGFSIGELEPASVQHFIK